MHEANIIQRRSKVLLTRCFDVLSQTCPASKLQTNPVELLRGCAVYGVFGCRNRFAPTTETQGLCRFHERDPWFSPARSPRVACFTSQEQSCAAAMMDIAQSPAKNTNLLRLRRLGRVFGIRLPVMVGFGVCFSSVFASCFEAQFAMVSRETLSRNNGAIFVPS